MKKITKKEIDLFFNNLIMACKKETTYSVIETTEEMGIDYKLVKEWTKSDKFFSEALKFCRTCCDCNAEMAGLFSRIKSKEAFKYMCENDDEFKEHYEKEKKLMALFYRRKRKAKLIIHL